MITPAISIEALVVLDAIEHRGSYAAAAEQLNKVPSALSYIVQKLEEQLNVTIFQRQGRRAVLTPAGKHLLAEGRKVLQAVNVLSEQTKTIANGWESKIRIGFDSIVHTTPIFTCLSQFLVEHENVELDVKEEVMNGTWEALIEDKVDLVIGAPFPVPSQKGIRAIKLGELDNVLVASKAYALANRTIIDNQPMPSNQLTPYRNVVVHDSSQHEIPWSINIIEGSQYFFVSSIPAKITALLAGIGIGYLPRNMAQQYINNEQFIEINLVDKPAKQDLFIAWKLTNKGKGLKTLIDMLTDEITSG